MGTRIIPPPVFGVNCGQWPIPAETPATMYVMFNDLITCPGFTQAPNGVTFPLSQVAGTPCIWDNSGSASPWSIVMFILGTPLRVRVIMALGPRRYYDRTSPFRGVEYSIFNNGIVACGIPNGGHSGRVMLWWLETVFEQVTDFNLPTDGDGLFLETFFVSTSLKVNRYANTTYHLNKKILF